ARRPCRGRRVRHRAVDAVRVAPRGGSAGGTSDARGPGRGRHVIENRTVCPAEPPAVAVGDRLPELTIEGTPTFIVASALATRDFQDVHHDRDLAHQTGSKDIFVNILTDTGLVQRFVTDWAGQRARITSIKLRLGVPWYAYDSLT